MSNEKDVSIQINDYHMLLNDLKNEEINLPEAFVYGYLIEKFLES